MPAEGGESAFLFTPFVRSWSTSGAVGSEAAEFAVCTGNDPEDDDAEPGVVAVCPAETEPETVVGDAAAAVAVALPDTCTDNGAVATAVLCCSVAKALDG